MIGAAIIIGQPETCRVVERQLDLLAARPMSIGWVVQDERDASRCAPDEMVLGHVAQLEAILAQRRPALAIVSLPGAMGDLIQSIRTRLRRAGVPDRFFPTIDDQLAGVGPRSVFAIDVGELLDRPPRRIDEPAVRALLAGRRVLITGAGGSIGSELARCTAKYGPSHLTLVDRSENALFEIDRQIARFHPGLPRVALLHDIVNERATHEHFARLKPQIIFHSAAHKHVPMMEDHPAAAVDNNLFGTKYVADAADAIAADRFVMISTDKAVNPSSIMGATKRLAEMYIQHLQPRSRTGYSMVRFGNVLGSSGSVIDVWTRQLADGGPLTVTDPRMTRYFMTIPEAAALVIQAAALADPGDDAEVFTLNMGEPVRVLDMARRFVELHGLRPVIEDALTPPPDPAASENAGRMRIVLTGARPGEKLFEELARDNSALRSTRHPDIDIWWLPRPHPQDVERIIAELSPGRGNRRSEEVAWLVRSFVPEMVQPIAA
jgi:FlaA1/EpsC-like NDP-sugar epimerase